MDGKDRIRLYNPLVLNDWPFKTFIIFIAVVHISLWGCILTDLLGLDLPLPLLKPILGFVYLAFLPGYLMLRIFKIHQIGAIESLLYSLGLSLSFVTIAGFIINMIFPLFGILNPITMLNLMAAFTCLTVLLSAISYIRDGSYLVDPILLNQASLRWFLALSLIPIIVIIGAYFVNYYQNNFYLLLAITIIAFAVLMLGSMKNSSTARLPLAIFMISMGLQLHTSLITEYILVCDSIGEYHVASLVIDSGIWDPSISGSYNAVISIAIMAPIFYNICDIDLSSVFKVIYPILFSFVPLGAYFVFNKFTNREYYAFLSSLLVMFVNSFFVVTALIYKQCIAELFLVLIIMLFITTSLPKEKQYFILLVFSTMLITSHYGIAFLFLLGLLFVTFFIALGNNMPFKDLLFMWHNKSRCSNCLKRGYILDAGGKPIPLMYVTFYIVAIITWYYYISDSSTFIQIVNMGKYAVNNVVVEFFLPESSRGLYLLTRESVSLIHVMTKILYIIFQICIPLGFIVALFTRTEISFNKKYFGLSLFFFFLLVLAIGPTGLSAMGPQRVFQLSLLTLAPFSIMGLLYLLEQGLNKVKYIKQSKSNQYATHILAALLVLFLLLNTGYIYEFTKDHPNSVSLSQKTIQMSGTDEDKAVLFGTLIKEQDVASGFWLGHHWDQKSKIFPIMWVEGFPTLTIYGGIKEESLSFYAGGPGEYIVPLDSINTDIKDSYVYLTFASVKENVGSTWYNPLHLRTAYKFSDLKPRLNDKCEVYSNGGSQVLIALDGEMVLK